MLLAHPLFFFPGYFVPDFKVGISAGYNHIVYHPGVVKGFYEQTNIQTLNDHNTVEEEVQNSSPDVDRQLARNICGAMMFEGDAALKKIKVLSGGEKALSAIAFIFSIFLIKPASFCLLDEIDAPLDDANVFRFNDLLQIIGENSQIIVITHNKRTMEFADMLFGITMEQKGISKVVSVDFHRK